MIDKLHPLLERQIKRCFGELEIIPPFLEGFLIDVNDAYQIFERDKKLSDHAFSISENQFQLINRKLDDELSSKRANIRRLLENTSYFDQSADLDRFDDDLEAVAELISFQFQKLNDTETKLKLSERKFKDALEKIGDNVWELNLETNEFVFLHNTNSSYLEGKAKSIDEVLLWNRLNTEDADAIRELIRKYREDQIENHYIEYRIVGKNNLTRWYLDRGGKIGSVDEGSGHRVIGTLSDITGRKKIEQALSASEEKYRGIIENMNLGLLEVDINETIIYANESFSKMCGIDKFDLIGKKPIDLFLRYSDKDLMDSKVMDRSRGISDTYEIKVRTANDEEKWWLISGGPLRDDLGKVVGSLGIHLDITEEKKLQQNLELARREALFLADAKDAFLANMSHELRTPMNGIIGMVRELLRNERDPKVLRRLQSINGAADHLLNILNDILDLSRISSGKMKLEQIGFNLNELVSSCIEVLESRVKEKGLILKTQLSQLHNCYFVGDPFRLKQILLNLLGNAIKFTELGSVSLEISSSNVSDSVARLVLKIADTGIGMDESFKTRLFKKFEQEDSSVVRRFGGTGLGLSITKELVDLMGGEIHIYSEKNRGTVFTVIIDLPIGQEAHGPNTKVQVPIQNALKGFKILLVEDNELNREVALISLDFMGLEVDVAENGLAALELLRLNNYNAILMDLQMPIMDGFEATKKIREQLKLELPIIALSANVLISEKEKCLACGMNDFVTKPFEESDLFFALYTSIHQRPPVTSEMNSPTHTVSVPKDSLYNLTQLTEMSRGDAEFVRRVVELFLISAKSTRDQITSFLDGICDFLQVQKAAHKIKPALHNLGMKDLYEMSKWIEFADAQEVSEEEIHSRVLAFMVSLEFVEKEISKNELGV